MECPFQVGDEVVAIAVDPSIRRPFQKLVNGKISRGSVYVVEGLITRPHWNGLVGLHLVGVEDEGSGFDSRMFRKVEKPRTSLSIEQFLTIKPGQFEEPRRAPSQPVEVAR